MSRDRSTDPDHLDQTTPADEDVWQAAWDTEDNYWFENFSSRPYALGADYYDQFRPAYRYGFESALHHMGRTWEEAELDLREGWARYSQRPESTAWEQIKDAVRDAWERVAGGATARTEERRPQVRE